MKIKLAQVAAARLEAKHQRVCRLGATLSELSADVLEAQFDQTHVLETRHFKKRQRISVSDVDEFSKCLLAAERNLAEVVVEVEAFRPDVCDRHT